MQIFKSSQWGGVLHDVGKGLTPLEILDKDAKLTEEEWIIMRRHTTDGRRILEDSGRWQSDIIDCTAHHHEKLDGSGYPDGLSGKEVSDISRMVAVADIFSALVDKRVYKAPMTRKDAYKLMLGMHGKLDMDLVEAFRPIALCGQNTPIKNKAVAHA